ncbi:MAG: outer membrane beta-barrel protein [Verrucomicrobiota bacterium]
MALCLGAFTAEAQYSQFSSEGVGPYFRVGAGPSFFENGRLTQFGEPTGKTVEFNTGLVADAAIGYAFNKYIATDFEFGGVGAEIKSVPGYFTDHTYLDNLSFLANVTLSFPIPRTIVVPYISVGGGGSVTVLDTDGFGNNRVSVFGSDSDTVFAWQASAGLQFRLNGSMLMGVGYKYFATEDSSFNYPPVYPDRGPNLPIAFEGVKTHSVMFIFQMRF